MIHNGRCDYLDTGNHNGKDCRSQWSNSDQEDAYIVDHRDDVGDLAFQELSHKCKYGQHVRDARNNVDV